MGIFWTLLIPAAAVEEIVEEAASIASDIESAVVAATGDAEGLAAQAIGRVATGLKNPAAVPGQGAAVYGSIPGALVTASASIWSKIVANSA